MKTTVINFLSGSGVGKSTTAALLFGEMKLRGYNVELVREFVKDWAWIGRVPNQFSQPVIYGNQLERESGLYGKVEYIITDSPLILCPIYQQFYAGHDSLKHQVLKDIDSANKIGVSYFNILLTRNKPFVQQGRFETEDVARKVDIAVRGFLEYHRMEFINLNVDDRERVGEILRIMEEDGYLNEKTKIG